MNKYLVVDSETSVKWDVFGEKDRASPFFDGNKIVMLGYTDGQGVRMDANGFMAALSKATLLVGQNIRFDMHYLAKTYGEPFLEWLYDDGNAIWDTQLAEYLLTAQQSKFASLDGMAEKYGGTLKDDKIKAYWDSGMQTEDIPKDELADYLKHDVLNTELVYKAQLEQLDDTGMLALVHTQMKALVATWEMGRNGMRFDMWRALDAAEGMKKEIAEAEKVVLAYMEAAMPGSDPSAGSNDMLSKLLFGGSYEVEVDKPVLDEEGKQVVFKSGIKKGMLKTKKHIEARDVKGLVKPKPEWATSKAGVYQVNDAVLKAVMESPKSPKEALDICKAMYSLRALSKDYKTYFVGFSALAWPVQTETGVQHFIRGNLNHTATETGRLSSSSPNMQNLSNKER